MGSRVCVSAAIQAHPDRAQMAEDLNACLGGGAAIVYDPAPTAYRSPWRTYRRALEETPADATHRLILQEDVVVCDYFLEGAALAAAARPERLLLFFVPGKPPHYVRDVMLACSRDETWAELELRTWIPVVAAMWPVALIEPLLSWYDAQRFPESLVADDEIVGRFMRARGEPPLASVPSLVEHPDTVPSIMNGHRRAGDGLDPGRRAACFIGDCGYCDARIMDWTRGAGG